jgi:hypothetical protein
MDYQGTQLIDKPDSRDYIADHLLWSGDVNLPLVVNLIDFCITHNQGNTNHCTAYWLTHIFQILNSIERELKVKLSPEEQWANQLINPWTAREEMWDYLQSALKSLKNYWLNYWNEKLTINWYAVVHRWSFKWYLAKKMPIYTWTHFTKTNYKKAKETWVWGWMDGPVTWWHAIAIIWYDENYYKNKNWEKETVYIALNSWWDKWWFFGNWTFLIREKDLENLFTSYVVFDDVDIKKIFKDVSEKSPLSEYIKWWAEKQLIKGYGDENLPNDEKLFMPDKPITRAELMVVLKRFYDLLK